MSAPRSDKQVQEAEEIEITPAMLEAGTEALFRYQDNWWPEKVVEKVFLAMWEARLCGHPSASPSSGVSTSSK